MSDTADLRHHHRITVAIAATDVARGHDGARKIDAPVAMCNISPYGVCLDTPIALDIDEQIWLTLLLPTGQRLVIDGKVRWIKTVQPPVDGCGWDDRFANTTFNRIGVQFISRGSYDLAVLERYLNEQLAA